MRSLTCGRIVGSVLLVWACVASAQGLPSAAGALGTGAAEPAAVTAYVERFDGTDPATVFEGLLTVGHDGPWTGTLTGEHYRLENRSTPGAVRYFYLTSLPGGGAPSQGAIHVTVSIDEVHPGAFVVGAGIVFDVDPDRGHYLAFVATDAGYALYVRGADGLDEAVSGTLDAFAPGERNRLTVRTAGSETTLEINGEFVAGIDFGRPPSGGVGIVALGAGTFAFTGFSVEAP